MNSEQIENALKENASTAPHFQGVYTRDTLPRKPRQGSYVVNFDKTGESGSHWVCMRIGKSLNTYFDSYGRKPPPFTQRDFCEILRAEEKIGKKHNTASIGRLHHMQPVVHLLYMENV